MLHLSTQALGTIFAGGVVIVFGVMVAAIAHRLSR
jgi:hypothetical protein